MDDIKTCLTENNITNFELKIVYAPAWTTEWMTNKTKEKLRKFGIAPPSNIVICPQCNSENTTLISEFGSTACKSLFKCIDCLEPFDFFKCI
jgi:ring-1,2-phenylacetyl-CoA epoxidase subunit PaaD